MASLSRTYRTPVASIVEANGLATDEVEPDAKLIIPIEEGKVVAGETGDLYSKHAVRYRTRRGDTVASVAQNFGVPADKVRSWNHLRGNTLHSGRTVRIYLPLVAGRESEAWTGGSSPKRNRRAVKTKTANTAKTTKIKSATKGLHPAAVPSLASEQSTSQAQVR
jgi:membrane-bound lytic murein transglycosylase D